MKKIYTLIAAATVAFGANAQYDLSIEFSTLTAGSTQTSSPLDISFVITNEGATALEITDTIFCSYQRDGVAVNVTNLNVTGVQYYLLDAPLAAGASTIVLGPTSIGFPTGFNEEICAVVYGVGAASVPDFAGDANTADNTACFTADIESGFDVGIADLEDELTTVYVSNGNLMIVNEGNFSDAPANLNIVSVNGQVVKSTNFVLAQGTTTVDVAGIAPGIYIVAIEVEGVLVTRKVSIQ